MDSVIGGSLQAAGSRGGWQPGRPGLRSVRTMPPPANEGGGGGWFVNLNPQRVAADSNGWGRGMLNIWCDPGCQSGLDAARRTLRGDTLNPSPSRIGPSTQSVRIGCSGVPATGRHLRHQPVTLVRLPAAGGSIRLRATLAASHPCPEAVLASSPSSGVRSIPRDARPWWSRRWVRCIGVHSPDAAGRVRPAGVRCPSVPHLSV